MRYIATIKRSDGNDSVGEMWNETATFDDMDRVRDVMEWANSRHNKHGFEGGELLFNVTLSIDQGSAL